MRVPFKTRNKNNKNIEHITFDWIGGILDEDWLSDVICDYLNSYKGKRVISWYENKYSRESTDYYKCINSNSYSYDDLFIYEMVDGTNQRAAP